MDGDLISRKALLEILDAKSDMAIARPAQMIYANAAKIVELLPAVDAEPVKRARWKPSPVPFAMPICSACGGSGYMNWVACPHCGAIMEGEAKDDG